VYDRHSYESEKRDALDRLASTIERILNQPDDNVRHIGGRRNARA
jgi:hypothetical protein